MIQDLMNTRWNIMQPQPDPGPTPEPEPGEEEKEERAQMDTQMLYKRLEKYFFQTRSIYLWGVVDDKIFYQQSRWCGNQWYGGLRYYANA